MNCDLLVLAPHPDDAELHCGGTIAAHVRQGKRVVVVDATRGEMASRGGVDERRREAEAAAAALGLADRLNLGLPDGALASHQGELTAAIAGCLRRYRPQWVLAMHERSRHPDHLALATASWPALKAAALHRYPVDADRSAGAPAVQDRRLLAYEAELPIAPTLLVPCLEADWQAKRAALACYGSQFSVDAGAPATSIARPGFLEWIDQRGRNWGYHAGAAYAEAFTAPEALVLPCLTALALPGVGLR